LEATPQDIIILDLLMPEMDGFEVIQTIKANASWKNIPIIVVTAKDLSDTDWEFLQHRVDRIIRKTGLSEQNLMNEVQDLLREHGAFRKEKHIHEEDPGS
jgi:hypothetical protein